VIAKDTALNRPDFPKHATADPQTTPPLTLISARSKMERKTKDLWFLFLGLIIRHIESKLTVSQPQLQEPESDNLFPNQR
jgi:hypothetical protein